MVLVIGGGALGGFIQSATSRAVSAQTNSPKVILTSGIELVDNTGKRVGFLGIDKRRNTFLAFFDGRGKRRAEFGLMTGDAPRLEIFGPQDESLLSLDLGQRNKPRLMMSDHDFNGRVYLGVAEPDAPSPNWKYDTWVLRFTGDHTGPLAVIGMTTGSAGGVAVFDKAGRQWRTPLK